MLLAVLIFFRNYAKIMLLSENLACVADTLNLLYRRVRGPAATQAMKIMLSFTEIVLFRFYTDSKENKDHQ